MIRQARVCTHQSLSIISVVIRVRYFAIVERVIEILIGFSGKRVLVQESAGGG